MKRAVKRVLLILLTAVLLLPLAACTQFLFLGPLINDRAAVQMKEEFLANLELAPGETLVDSVSWAGNSSGTGDHTELWAGVLTFADSGTPYGTPLDRDISSWEQPGPRTADLEELFPILSTLDSWDGYYLREAYGDAVTQWDFRGC
mgnify:FL=1